LAKELLLSTQYNGRTAEINAWARILPPIEQNITQEGMPGTTIIRHPQLQTVTTQN
jgi:hypothetical protein